MIRGVLALILLQYLSVEHQIPRKVLLKSGTTNTRVVHMEFFKVVNEYVSTSLETKALFLRTKVRGYVIFP